MFSGSSPSKHEEPQEEKPETLSDTSTLLKLGTLVVIGAMAANVFGFRYSRWAVGKEIHRGWETRARNIAREAARARASARADRARARAQASQQQAESRAREEARQQQSKREHDSTKRAYKRWEQSFGNEGYRWEETYTDRNGGYQRVRIEFDTRFEEMFKGPFGMPEELLREFLRGAQNQSRRARVDDFDAFKFWEEMHGAEWRQGRPSGGAGGHPGFSGNRARYYAVLGLRDGASPGEVKTAYRREAMKWHPDRYRGKDRAGAERRFREVTEAYEALK